MRDYDIAVIGGGVIGGAVLRELSKYRLRVCLAEKESDVAMGASKANSGIVHAGFDAAEGSNNAWMQDRIKVMITGENGCLNSKNCLHMWQIPIFL